MKPELQFRELLAHAWEHSPLYRRIYEQHGIRTQDLPHVQLHELPVVSKADVMQRLDEAVTDRRLRRNEIQAWLDRDSNPLNLYHDEYIVIHSSGGSSIRSIVPWKPKTWRLMTTTAAADILPMGADSGAPLRSAFYYASSAHSASSTNAMMASHSAHQVLRLSMWDPLEEIWAKLNAFQPEHLSSYASAAGWLAAWTLEGKLRIRPRSVLVSGDRLTPQARSLIEQAWGADIYDLYASVEGPCMAVRKPARSDFRVLTELNVLEVVDEKNRMVQPGQRGRIVMTNLINYTLPLIRFDLMDEAVLGRACFGAETLETIHGKTNVRLPVRLTNGEVTTLSLPELHRLDVPACGNVQFISHSPDDVEILYEAQSDLDGQIEAAFREVVARASSRVRSVRAQRVASVPNDAKTFKYLDVITPERAALPLRRLSDDGGAILTSGAPGPIEGYQSLSPSERPASIFLRFLDVARRTPNSVAATDGERQLTYQECSRDALKIALGLRQWGFDEQRPVAVLCSHGATMIAPLLGVLGAGGFYLALDPYVPAERLQAMVAETQPEYILAAANQRELAMAIAGPSTTVLPVDDLLSAQLAQTQLPEVSLETPACLLYTSGSTGTPKGTIFSHGTVLHRVHCYACDFRLTPDDRISLLQSYAVSAGVRDIYGAMLNGATLAIYDVRSRGVPGLPAWLHENRISVFYAVPTVWRLLVDLLGGQPFPALRSIRLGGEAVLPADLEDFKKHFGDGCCFVNGYASTETGTVCQFFMDRNTSLAAGRMPIGTPLAGAKITILDEDGKAAPDAVGEVAVDADTLASGYWDADRRRSIPLPRPVRTGDLGYLLADGRIVLTGRRGSMVKIHGYRVDLREIEKLLCAVDGVKEVVAVSRTTRGGDSVIAVYYVPLQDGAVLRSETLRRALAAVLPTAAVAITFQPLSVLPRLPGGKINPNVLPEPVPPRLPPARQEVIYGNQTEEKLAEIWKDVLGVQSIPADADFFALGGDSVTAFRVLNRILAGFQVEVPVQEFFNHSTLPEMARVIGQ